MRLSRPLGSPGRDSAGERGLEPCRAQSKAERVNREDHLIDTHSLSTNCMRKEYSIEKTYDAACNAGEREDERSLQDWSGLRHEKRHRPVILLFVTIFGK